MNDAAFSAVSIVGFFARWLTFAGVIVTFGAVVFRFAVVGRALVSSDVAKSLNIRAARCAALAVLLILPGALARLYFQTAEMRFPDDPWLPLAGTLLTQSSWGYLWMGQVALSVIVAIMMQRASRDDSSSVWRALSVLSFALLVTPSLASHAMSAHMSRWLTLPADMLHLTGVSVWIGTLIVMFVASGRISTTTVTRTIAALLVPFSPLALAGAATVVASGVVSSYAHLGGFGELTRTTYGRLLLAKVALLLCVAGMGWRNWKRMTPQLDAQGSAPLRRSIVTELAFAVLVLLVTSALVITPPPMMHMSN
ncbi:MAG TPA: CopD family protein [Gemmatimonadaceae bacterium]